MSRLILQKSGSIILRSQLQSTDMLFILLYSSNSKTNNPCSLAVKCVFIVLYDELYSPGRCKNSTDGALKMDQSRLCDRRMPKIKVRMCLWRAGKSIDQHRRCTTEHSFVTASSASLHCPYRRYRWVRFSPTLRWLCCSDFHGVTCYG